MTDPDPFDEIVRRLEWDLTFPDVVEQPRAVTPPTPAPHHEPEDEPFYRRVEPRDPVPQRPGVLLAWLGILGGPATIMLAGIMHFFLPRPLLLGLGLVFVASAIYLISQLPERGPAEPFWPDDGAQI